MTTRAAVVAKADSYDGYKNGAGYDCANQFSADLGRPTEAWCGDFVTDIYKRTGIPLPSMQVGCRTGYAYCPAGRQAAINKGAWKPSWEALPGDAVIFHWPGGNPEGDHTELAEGWVNGVLHTIGGNSGPSNVDGYTGRGGVHKHVWTAPRGSGNGLILGVIDMAHFVTYSAPFVPPKPAPTPAPTKYRLLMLKSPLMTGNDVKDVQTALQRHGFYKGYRLDGVFGQHTRDAVLAFQQHMKLKGQDGIVGPETRKALGLPS